MQRSVQIAAALAIVIFLSSSAFVFADTLDIKGDHELAIDYLTFYPEMMPEGFFRQSSLEIFSPRCSAPVFVEDGQSFIIQIDNVDQDQVLYIYLSTAYEPVVDDVWCEQLKRHQLSDGRVELIVSVPNGTPEELYNLTILSEEGDDFLSYTEPRAVQVCDTISDSFKFVHITDFHVGDPRGFLESIQETLGWKSIKKCIEEINLLNPDFVIISGDLVYGQMYPFEYRVEYENCYEMIQLFDVPTFLTPGNHDGYNRILEDGLAFWEDYFGPLYYSFDYGSAHFQAINSYDMSKLNRLTFLIIPLNWGGSISDEQVQWITKDLQDHQNSSLIFQFMHHNPIWNTRGDSLMLKDFTNRETLLAINKAMDVDMVCAGHVHYDSVNIENNTIYVTTTTPESEIHVSDGYWGYRMIEVKDGQIQSYNYKEPKYSIPSYHLWLKQWSIQGAGMAEIQNDLEMDIEAHVKFALPLGSFHVNNGEITMQRNKGMQSELYITTPVPAESTAVILVSAL